MELGGVNGCFEFHGPDAFLGLEVPEAGAAVLRGGEEIAAVSRPASKRVLGRCVRV
jgi:hypothetical protein